MILDAYIRESGHEFGKFALRIGVSRQALNRYINGQRFPRPDVLRRIHDETEGQVTANDFLPAPAPTPPTTGEAA